MEKKETATLLIRIVFLLLLLVWSFLIVQPFILVIIWAIIIAVAFAPIFDKLLIITKGKHKKLITFLFALSISALCLIPSYLILQSIVESTTSFAHQVKNESFELHPLAEKVKEWPLIGPKLYDNWNGISENLQEYIINNKEDLLEKGKTLFSSITGLLGTLVTFFISLMLSLVFVYYSDAAYQSAVKFMRKLMGDKGEEVVLMSRDTTRSVVKGIILVAVIQTVLAFIGFKMVGLAGAGIFTLIVLISAIVQIPVLLVMLPPIVMVFSSYDTITIPVIFAIYSFAVSLADNFLKPMLLGKGLKTPMIVILIGTIGGLMLHGIIGLFVGPVVLAVMYSMYNLWLVEENITIPESLNKD